MRDSGKSQALPRGSQYHELILYLSLVGYSFYWKKPIIGELTVMNRFCTWILNLLSLIGLETQIISSVETPLPASPNSISPMNPRNGVMQWEQVQ